MKKVKTAQKTAVIVLIASLILGLSSCVKDKRFDYSEMNIRIKALAPELAFNETEMFYSDSVYYVYYSLFSEDDMLLTLKEDEKNRLDRVTLTLDAKKTRESAEAFRRFSLLLADIFIPELDKEALCAATGIDDVSLYTSDLMESYTQGFYKAVLFCSGEAVCFMMTYG